MNREQFKIWLEKNSNLKKKSQDNYLRAISTISNEMGKWGLEADDIYSINDEQKLDIIMSKREFIEKNKRGNQMYSAALKYYKRFLNSELIKDNGDEIVPSYDVALININTFNKEPMSTEELYQATSLISIISPEEKKIRGLQYYCAVVNNVIRETFKLLRFEIDEKEVKEKGITLHGKLAENSLRINLNGLNVKDLGEESEFSIKYTNIKDLIDLNNHSEVDETAKSEKVIASQNLIKEIYSYIKGKGFTYSVSDIKNLYLSLRSKPFVIIAGISGTGKTKIAQLFAESIGATEANGQFKLIPVRPDWSDGSELLGYIDLKNEFQKGPLTEMIEHALDNPKLPHYVLLDEMNLARVEYYFSDVLSVMESRRRDGEIITSSNLLDEKFLGRALKLPENLYIIGTVNMDETTHPFSKKVLDRANTIEFNEIHLNNFDHLGTQEQSDPLLISNNNVAANFISLKDIYVDHRELIEKVSIKLEEINKILEPINAHVGYRVRDEICFYMVHNANENLLDENEAFDYCLMQKILPRITGSDGRIDILLSNLFESLTGMPYEAETIDYPGIYPRSSKKVAEMIRRYHMDGFTSFWIS